MAKLQGNLTVRDARDGETLKALNGKDYILRGGMTVIADDAKPLAVAGIIGGVESGCTETTTDVFLEVALFDPASVARTGRALMIDSDARYRFERGVDPAFVETGAHHAIALIQKLCGGTAGPLTRAGNVPDSKRSIPFNPERVKTLGGVSLSAETCQHILISLGFTGNWQLATGNFTISPPSWRADVEGEADLVEEILRIHGYGNIPPTPLPKLPGIGKPALSPAQKREHLTRRALAARGMTEICTWSFLPEAQAKLFGGGNPKLKLLNPISAELDSMRPSLLPNLLDAARRNGLRGFASISFFEAGLQFHDITPEGQRLAASGLRTGVVPQNNYKDNLFQHSERPVDAFDAKSDALYLLQALGVNKCDVTSDTPPWYHPGRSGALTLGGKIVLGYFGEIHPGLLSAFDLTGSVAAFEIFLDAIPLPRSKSKARPALKPSDFQSVERDFAFIVDESVTAADMLKALAQADKQLITGVGIFDVYTGKGVEPGKKSVALKVTLQAQDRTLSEADITAAGNAVVVAAAKHFGGQLRQ